MSELSFDGYVREPETKQKPQRVLDTRYVNSREQFLSDPRFAGIEPFLSKVWLSSPTMHGDEQRYVDEAIRTNWVSTVGENINKVEEECAAIIGRKYDVALSSGTAALHLVIRLAGERLYGPAPSNHGTLE